MALSKENAIEAVASAPQNYYHECLTFAKEYASFHHSFLAEDIRSSFNFIHPTTTPAESRVWGAVIQQLKRDGLITHSGYVSSKGRIGHNHPVSYWVNTK